MEIKVECACGQPFEFDVEPVNGQMPCEVNCPTCGKDATALANAYMTQTLSTAAVSPPAAPEPAAGLRINRAHTPPAPAPAAAAPVVPPSITAMPKAAAQKSKGEGDGFVKGVAGALAAALLGMFGWYLLIKVTGYEIGYAAWGVGALTGFGARLLGATGSTKLGVLAGLFAFVAIIGGQYLVVRGIAATEFDKIGVVAYEGEMAAAKSAVALKTDEEMKAFIAKQDEVSLTDVTTDRLKEFRETDLPKFRGLVAGKPSQAEFISRMSGIMNSWSVQFEMLKSSFGLFTLLWIFLGVGSAYKISAGTND